MAESCNKSRLELNYDILICMVLTIICFLYYFYAKVFGGLNGDFGEGAVTLFYRNYLNFIEGKIEFWNSYEWTGMPALGHTVFQTIYPIYLGIYAFLKNISFEMFLPIVYGIHMSILLIGMYSFCRVNNLSRYSSLIAVLVTAFSDELIKQSTWTYLFTGFVYYPLMLTFIFLFKKNKGVKAWIYVLLGGITLGMSGLANQGQTLLINILVACLFYLIYVLAEHNWKFVLPFTGKMFSFGLIGAGICAPAFIPMVVFTQNCTRYVPEMGFIDSGVNLTMEAFTTYASSLSSFGSFLQFPSVVTEYSEYWQCGAIAVMVTVFAIIGFISNKNNGAEKFYILVLAVCCICYASNVILPYLFYYIPGYNAIREPFLYIPYLVLPLSFATANGIDTVIESRGNAFKFFSTNIQRVLLLVLLLICGVGLLLPYYFKAVYFLIFVFSIVFVCIFVFADQFKFSRICGGVVLTIVFCVQLYANYCDVSRTATYKDVYEKIESHVSDIKAVKSLVGDEDDIERSDRFFGFGVTAWSNNAMSLTGSNEGLGYINPITRADKLLNMVGWERQAILRNIKYWYTTTDNEDYYHQVLEGFATKLGTVSTYATYDATETEMFDVYKADTNDDVWLVNHVISVEDIDDLSTEKVSELLNSDQIDFSNSAYVNTDLTDINSMENTWDISDFYYSGDEISMKVQTEQDSLLVTAESWYPGWKVYIDGDEQDVLQVNICCRGCFVSAGEHTVRFVYEPIGFKSGIILGCVIVAFWIMILMLMLYFKRKKTQNQITI